MGLARVVQGYRCVCHVERDAYAAAVLVARMVQKTLDPAPIWDDLKTFDGGVWRGLVDIITAGFPCQPWSVAGKKKGEEDERWIWPEIARIICDVRPGLVFLENVPGLVSGGGLGPVLADLAALGFDAEWGLFRASDVGAPHRRERWFCLAYRNEPGFCREWLCRLSEDGQPQYGHDSHGCDSSMADTKEQRSERTMQARRWRTGSSHDGIPTWPPGPNSPDWQGIIERWPELAPAVGNANGKQPSQRFNGRKRPEPIEAGPGWRSSPAVESSVRGVAHGISDRMDRLRCLGNAVVPAQAELAFRTLAKRIAPHDP